MKTLEIIHLRSAACSLEALSESIAQSVRAVGDDEDVVTVYRRRGLGSDLAVHIRHPHPAKSPELSALGLRLASELKAYGLVVHTVWEDL